MGTNDQVNDNYRYWLIGNIRAREEMLSVKERPTPDELQKMSESALKSYWRKLTGRNRGK